jgi:hypothetical protein
MLFVTTKTVEAHTKQIFAKLEIDAGPTRTRGCSRCSRSSATERNGQVLTEPGGRRSRRTCASRKPHPFHLVAPRSLA